MANTDTVLLTSAIVTLASTTAASAMPKDKGGHGELPKPRLLFGTALTFVGLSFLGGVAPQVAKPLAFCVAMTAFTYYGLPVASCTFTGKNVNGRACK